MIAHAGEVASGESEDEAYDPSAVYRRTPTCKYAFLILATSMSTAYVLTHLTPVSAWPVESDNSDQGSDLCMFSSNRTAGSTTRPRAFDGVPPWANYTQFHRDARKRIEQNHTHGTRVLILDEKIRGFGDGAKGLSTALYVAMLTGRALFVNWTGNDVDDFSEFFGRNLIDVRLPRNFGGDCTTSRNGGQLHWWHIYEDISHESSCLKFIYFNMDPSVLLNFLENTTFNMLGQIMPRTHAIGCAMRYMFSFATAYKSMEDHTNLVLSRDSGPIPTQYVGVHLRFGDVVFDASAKDGAHALDGVCKNNTKKQCATKVVRGLVADALDCARQLGQQLFRANDSWGVFFASDSSIARQFALSDERVVVAELRASPCHSGHDSHCSLWGFMGDQLMLQRTRGMVKCGYGRFKGGPCRESGFSKVASEISLTPLESQWEVTPRGCVAPFAEVSGVAW